MPYRRHYGPSMHGQLYDGGDYPGMLAVLAPTLGELDSEAERLKRAGEIAGVGLEMYPAQSGVSAHEAVTPIGRASWRDRVCQYVALWGCPVKLKEKKTR